MVSPIRNRENDRVIKSWLCTLHNSRTKHLSGIIGKKVCINRSTKKQVLVRLWRKGNPSALLVGLQTGAATVENSMEFP